jgi:uncharacterized protein
MRPDEAAPAMTVDESWPPDREVPSPCVDVCRLDPRQRHCEGCLRTIDEIAGWSAFDRRQRLQVWSLLRSRRAGLSR